VRISDPTDESGIIDLKHSLNLLTFLNPKIMKADSYSFRGSVEPVHVRIAKNLLLPANKTHEVNDVRP